MRRCVRRCQCYTNHGTRKDQHGNWAFESAAFASCVSFRPCPQRHTLRDDGADHNAVCDMGCLDQAFHYNQPAHTTVVSIEENLRPLCPLSPSSVARKCSHYRCRRPYQPPPLAWAKSHGRGVRSADELCTLYGAAACTEIFELSSQVHFYGNAIKPGPTEQYRVRTSRHPRSPYQSLD